MAEYEDKVTAGLPDEAGTTPTKRLQAIQLVGIARTLVFTEVRTMGADSTATRPSPP